MVIAGLLIAVAILICGILYFLGMVSGVLRNLIKELREERELILLQKQIVSLTAKEVAIQRSLIDKRYEMMVNTLTMMKLIADKQADPVWAKKFDEGRENSKWN